MWYRFEKGNPKGICRVKHLMVCWYDMEHGGDCFDEDFTAPDGLDRVIPYVETIEDENNSDRSHVFIRMDNDDIYELKMEKLSKDQFEKCSNFYGDDDMQYDILCATKEAGIKKDDLTTTWYDKGLVGVFNLGMETMYRFLKRKK